MSSGTWLKQPDLKPFSQVSDELSVYNGVILQGIRIVIPCELQKSTLNLAQSRSSGRCENETTSSPKSLIWWPGFDKDTDSMIGQCLPGRAQGPQTNPEPLLMSPMPTQPWHILFTTTYADLFLRKRMYFPNLVNQQRSYPTMVLNSPRTTLNHF